MVEFPALLLLHKRKSFMKTKKKNKKKRLHELNKKGEQKWHLAMWEEATARSETLMSTAESFWHTEVGE